MWTKRHTFAPIDIGGNTSYLVLTDLLLFNTRGFQTTNSSTFYIHTSLQWSPDVYSTIMRVLCAVPILAHCTIVVLLLHFQICPGIHPPMSLHHMLAVPLPLSSRSAMIYSSCCNSLFSLCATGSVIVLLLHLNLKYRRCRDPMRFSCLYLGLLDPSLTSLSSKYNPTHHRFHHCELVQCSALLRLGLARLLSIGTFSRISSSPSLG